MNTYVRLFLFVVGTSVAFFFANYFMTFTLSKIMKFYDVQYSWYAQILTTFMELSIISLRLFPSSITSKLYYAAFLWWGCIVNLGLCSILYYSLELILPLPCSAGLILVIVPASLLTAFGVATAKALNVENIDIRISKAKTNIKIAHLSDLHLGPIYSKESVCRLVADVKKLNPDFVVITGDLFDSSMTPSSDMVEPFNKLDVNIYYVLGNHDSVAAGIEAVHQAISKTKITLLRNEQVNCKGINLIGVDYLFEKKHVEKQLKQIKIEKEQCNVLLSHLPEIKAEELESYGIQLHLCGHTHGGQMLPFHIQSWLSYPYMSGLYKSSNSDNFVYVSEGVGTVGSPIRICSNSSFAIINIHP